MLRYRLATYPWVEAARRGDPPPRPFGEVLLALGLDPVLGTEFDWLYLSGLGRPGGRWVHPRAKPVALMQPLGGTERYGGLFHVEQTRPYRGAVPAGKRTRMWWSADLEVLEVL